MTRAEYTRNRVHQHLSLKSDNTAVTRKLNNQINRKKRSTIAVQRYTAGQAPLTTALLQELHVTIERMNVQCGRAVHLTEVRRKERRIS